MQHRVCAVGAQFHVSVVDVRELTQVFGFDIGFRVINGTGAALHGDHFTVEIFHAFHVVVIRFHHHQQAAFVVAIREIDSFFTFFGNGDARQRQVNVFGLQCRDNAAEIHWLQGVIQFEFFCDSGPQINVKTNVFITLFEFKRYERRVSRHNQFVGSLRGHRKRQGKCSQ